MYKCGIVNDFYNLNKIRVCMSHWNRKDNDQATCSFAESFCPVPIVDQYFQYL